MGLVKLEKVLFGAKMVGYGGRGSLNCVGAEGILAVYKYADAPDECILVFHYDAGATIRWVRHARSQFEIADGILRAQSVESGTVKEYDISTAIEAGPEMFRADNPDIGSVPEGWMEVYANIFSDHAWADEPFVNLPG